MKNKEIYLDHAATTKPYDEVIDKVCEIMKYQYGNASSVHTKGVEAYKIIQDSTQKMADIFDCETNEIVFTSGGTEANNMAIKGYCLSHRGIGNHVVTTKYEHESILNSITDLEKYDFKSNHLNQDQLMEVEKYINKNTLLCSIATINNETGQIFEIKELSKKINTLHSRCVFHSDAVQSLMKYDLTFSDLPFVHMISLSGHKIHGPKGVGALYIKNSLQMKPLLSGGDQQNTKRAGTENTAAIAGFALACEISKQKMKEHYEKVKYFNQYMREKLLYHFPDCLIISEKNASTYILNVAFKNIKSEILLNHLSSKNICVSSGSACSSKKNQKSHVLTALNVDPSYIQGAIRFSFDSTNTLEELDKTLLEIKNIMPLLKTTRRKK